MSEMRTINCPRCNELIAYSSNEEGKVGECPKCQEKIWYSKLVHPTHEEEGSKQAAQPSTADSDGNSPIVWGLVVLLGVFLAIDSYRLRSELRSLGQEIRSLHQKQPGTNQDITDPSLALAKADLNHAQLAAIVSEMNAIEAVIETKLSQFTTRSTEDAARIEAFASSLATVMEEFDQLEISISEIQDAMNAIIDNYSRLETDLLNRQ